MTRYWVSSEIIEEHYRVWCLFILKVFILCFSSSKENFWLYHLSFVPDWRDLTRKLRLLKISFCRKFSLKQEKKTFWFIIFHFNLFKIIEISQFFEFTRVQHTVKTVCYLKRIKFQNSCKLHLILKFQKHSSWKL